MRPNMLALAVLIAAVPTAPATAQAVAGAGFSGGAAFANAGSGGVTVHRGSTFNRAIQGGSDDARRNRHRHDERSGYVYSDLRAGYDLNRGWASDSYNDWWHDRPDRAFPRWMSTNQDCQRQWWSGSGWRC